MKDFAWDQGEKNAGNPSVWFEYNDQCILNPWMEETGRGELSTEEAIKNYGEENVIAFVREAVKHIS